MSNTRSFEELCLSNYNELVGFAVKLTKNKAAAEDIVQDSVVRALGAWDRWEPHGDDPAIQARAWMCQIIRNVFANYYRSTKRSKAVREQGDDIALVVSNCDVVHTTGSRYYAPIKSADDVVSEELEDALNRIKPEWAEVIRLTLIEGLTQQQAADRLGIKFGTVRSRTARALAALARILGPSAKRRWGYDLPGYLVGRRAGEHPTTFKPALGEESGSTSSNARLCTPDLPSALSS